jgi:hypothetical protein
MCFQRAKEAAKEKAAFVPSFYYNSTGLFNLFV